jgi:hypothetical protein
MSKPTRKQWEAQQEKFRLLDRKLTDHQIALSVKYGDPQWASRVEKAKAENLRQQMGRVSDRLFSWLREMSDRDWSMGVPTHWVCSTLTYDDARKQKSERLSVVPPLSYGQTHPIS